MEERWGEGGVFPGGGVRGGSSSPDIFCCFNILGSVLDKVPVGMKVLATIQKI
jgi:hypothetical protein